GADGRKFPWGVSAPDCTLTNVGSCASSMEAVGSHPAGASPYGLLDMAGNAWEWVADWYDSGYYAISPPSDPAGPATGSSRVRRGGDFGDSAADLRAAHRKSDSPTTSDDD